MNAIESIKLLRLLSFVDWKRFRHDWRKRRFERKKAKAIAELRRIQIELLVIDGLLLRKRVDRN